MIKQKRRNLTPKRIVALKALLSAKPDFASDHLLSSFLSSYLLCEALANRLVEYYELDVGAECMAKEKSTLNNRKPEIPPAKDSKKNQFKTLRVPTIRKSINHFALHFASADLNSLFKSSNNPGENRTARQLRNSYIHSLSSNAHDEICSRIQEFLDTMGRFIEILSEGQVSLPHGSLQLK